MAGLADVVFPVDSLPKLNMEGVGDQSMPSGATPAPSGDLGGSGTSGDGPSQASVSTSPQGKGVGLFALGTMADEEMDVKIKDPKVSKMSSTWPSFLHPAQNTVLVLSWCGVPKSCPQITMSPRSILPEHPNATGGMFVP